ncbi:hypothetical protein [Streptomyces sp. NPDC002671]
MHGKWLAGGAFEAPAGAVRTARVWHTLDAGVRVVTARAVLAVVAGVCRGDDAEVSRVAVAVAVAAGQAEEIVSMGGSYWMVVHDIDRRRTVVVGDLAEVRELFTAATDEGVGDGRLATCGSARPGPGPGADGGPNQGGLRGALAAQVSVVGHRADAWRTRPDSAED